MFSAVAMWQSAEEAPVVPGLTYGRFVGGRSSGTNLRAAWSNDGITWNTATTPNSLTYPAGDFSPELGLYVLGGGGAVTNSFISSTNGVTWTSRSKPNSQVIGSVTWCSGFSRFVAVANQNVFTSTDGITWIVAFTHSLTGDKTLEASYAETPSGNYFVGAISKTVAEATAFTELIYSTDGITFATYSFLENGFTFRVATDVLYNKGLNRFISTSRYESTGNILTSQNVTSGWSSYTDTPLSGPRLSGGSDNVDTFVISNSFGSNTTAGVKYSTGGLSGSWTASTMPSGTKDPYDIIYAPEIDTWVTSNWSNTTTFTSPDAITWTSRTGIANVMRFLWGPGIRTTGYKQGSGIT